MFNIVFLALGDSVAIVVGQLLGAGRMEEARDADNKMIAFAVMNCIVAACRGPAVYSACAIPEISGAIAME